MKKLLLIVLSGLFAVTATYAQKSYTMDKAHARLSFSAKHMGISFVDGIFKDFDATLVSSKDDFSDAKIELTAQIKSIDTGVKMRDEDLTKNFFEVDKYPTLHFVSTSFKKVSGNKYKLAGKMTMHGVTKPVVFDVVYNGEVLNPLSHKNTVGFTISGVIDRNAFGIGNDPKLIAPNIKVWSNVEFAE